MSFNRTLCPARSLIQCGIPTGLQLPSDTSAGPLQAADWSLLHHTPPRAVETQLLHDSLHHGLQRNLFSCAWSTLSCSLASDLVSAGLFLSYFLIPLSQLLLLFCSKFSPWNCYSRGSSVVTDVLYPGQGLVFLGSSWHWLCWKLGWCLAVSETSHLHCVPASKTLLCTNQ